MPVGIKWNRLCIYLFNVAPGLLCRRKRHQNIKDIRSCCFTATGTTAYLLSCPRTALQDLLTDLCSSQPLPRYAICHQPPRLFPLMEKNMQYPGENFSRWRQCYTFCSPPPFSSRHPCHHTLSVNLVLLLSTTYSSPIYQATSILLLKRTRRTAHFFSCFLYLDLSFQMDGVEPWPPSTHLVSLAG